MKSILKWTLMLPLVASVAMSGCKKEDDDSPTPPSVVDPAEGKTLIFETNSADAEVDVKLYVDEAAFVGYNRLYVVLYEQGTKNIVKDAKITFKPMMEMNSGMNHGCPVESPEQTKPEDGLFMGAAVFVMPSLNNGVWNMTIEIENNENGKMGSAMGNFDVVAPTVARMFSLLSPLDNSKVFVSLVEPLKPEVGENVFSVCINKKETMMEWPAITDFQVDYKPWMPTMGHSSPYTAPTHTSMGHYVGEVNYTMPGLWYMYIMVKDKDDNVIIGEDEQYFEMTL